MWVAFGFLNNRILEFFTILLIIFQITIVILTINVYIYRDFFYKYLFEP